MAAERDLSEVRFLTVAEVASIMRVSKMTVYRLVHSGEMPPCAWGVVPRPGGRRRRLPARLVRRHRLTGRRPAAGPPPDRRARD